MVQHSKFVYGYSINRIAPENSMNDNPFIGSFIIRITLHTPKPNKQINKFLLVTVIGLNGQTRTFLLLLWQDKSNFCSSNKDKAKTSEKNLKAFVVNRNILLLHCLRANFSEQMFRISHDLILNFNKILKNIFIVQWKKIGWNNAFFAK